ncbi:MAG: two-component sensor histidine kinase [Lachnospiraceae bacterium]|nr:two-component sensor histidine kinase [Lachnospiraceae bacterium]
MRKRINIYLMAIASVAILVTMLLVTVVYYDVFKKQVFEDLRTYTQVLKMFHPEEMMSGQAVQTDSALRVTLIAENGVVLYDTEVDAKSLDNHGGRPEIVEAARTGEGTIVRTSPTFNKSTFYYAARMENGIILRTSKEADGMVSIFLGALPMILLMAGALFAVCVFLARYLTKRLIVPIDQLAKQLDTNEEVKIYKELQPFVQTIRQQHENILQSARIRQDFTANVSHELKTPLTSISGYAELIESGMADEKDVQRFVVEIHKNSKRLLTLINDIIRLSELDVIGEETQYEQLNLSEIARTCVEMLQMNAEKHQVKIQFLGENCFVTANKEMMEELLYNLCDNAIRYNKKGGTVTVSVREETKDIVLAVQDTGIGISKEHQERIFERFYRVDKSRSKSTGGTGLGLAIVKHIIASHKARLELISEPGEGTTMLVYFKK